MINAVETVLQAALGVLFSAQRSVPCCHAQCAAYPGYSLDACRTVVVFALAAASIWCLLAPSSTALLDADIYVLDSYSSDCSRLIVLAALDDLRVMAKLWRGVVSARWPGSRPQSRMTFFGFPSFFTRVASCAGDPADESFQGVSALRGHDSR